MFNVFFRITLLLSLLMLASCGGMTLQPMADVPATQSAAVPNLPLDLVGEVTRGASDVTSIPGASAVASFGGTVEGESMLLQSSAEEMAWALYRVEGLAGRNATSLSVLFTFGELQPEYFVGVSNFSESAWEFLAPGALPEFEHDLSAEESRLVSRLGNLYFVVVVSGGASLQIDSAGVISEVATSETVKLPAAGLRPSASQGLADRIEVSWAAIEGAESYELQRQHENDDDDEPWVTIAAQAETMFSDTAIELDTEYKYRVRGVNAAGAGSFSKERSGFAGTRPQDMDDDDVDDEVEGELIAMTETTITVGAREFMLNAATVVLLDDDQGAGTLADLAVGMFVEVHALPQSDGTWLATRIEIEDDAQGGDDGDGGDDENGDDDNGDDEDDDDEDGDEDEDEDIDDENDGDGGPGQG